MVRASQHRRRPAPHAIRVRARHPGLRSAAAALSRSAAAAPPAAVHSARAFPGPPGRAVGPALAGGGFKFGGGTRKARRGPSPTCTCAVAAGRRWRRGGGEEKQGNQGGGREGRVRRRCLVRDKVDVGQDEVVGPAVVERHVAQRVRRVQPLTERPLRGARARIGAFLGPARVCVGGGGELCNDSLSGWAAAAAAAAAADTWDAPTRWKSTRSRSEAISRRSVSRFCRKGRPAQLTSSNPALPLGQRAHTCRASAHLSPVHREWSNQSVSNPRRKGGLQKWLCRKKIWRVPDTCE